LKTIELINEEVWLVGFENHKESVTYVMKSIDYSAVEGIIIDTPGSNFNIIVEAAELQMPNLKMVGLIGPLSLDFFTTIYQKLNSVPPISQVHIEATGMTEPPDFIFESKHLNHLVFRHEDALKIPGKLYYISNLQKLEFHYCSNFTSVPDDIKNLQNLDFFNLWGVHTDYISPELFLLPVIRSINFYRSSYSPTVEVQKALEIFKAKNNTCFSSSGYE